MGNRFLYLKHLFLSCINRYQQEALFYTVSHIIKTLHSNRSQQGWLDPLHWVPYMLFLKIIKLRSSLIWLIELLYYKIYINAIYFIHFFNNLLFSFQRIMVSLSHRWSFLFYIMEQTWLLILANKKSCYIQFYYTILKQPLSFIIRNFSMLFGYNILPLASSPNIFFNTHLIYCSVVFSGIDL